jgi:hypothetical protein
MIFSFTTTSSATSGYMPLTLTFQPSSIPLTGSQFLSKVIYDLPGQTVARTNNFTATPDGTDCRTNLTCILPSEKSTYIITISAFIGPDSFTPTIYSLSATNILPFFTTNPTISPASPHVFGEVHLLRSRAWSTSNTQIFLLETNNPNYLLINYNG